MPPSKRECTLKEKEYFDVDSDEKVVDALKDPDLKDTTNGDITAVGSGNPNNKVSGRESPCYSDKQKAQWNEMFTRLRRYRESNGSCNVPGRWKADPKLANWVDTQRQNQRRGTLSAERIQKLNSLNFIWIHRQHKTHVVTVENESKWYDRFEELQTFLWENGHQRVVLSSDPVLYHWIQKQRQCYKRGIIRKDRKDLLDSIGFEWAVSPPRADTEQKNKKVSNNQRKIKKRSGNSDNDSWVQTLTNLQAFKNNNGHINFDLVASNESRDLARWINEQKAEKAAGSLSSEKQRLLQYLGVSWEEGTPSEPVVANTTGETEMPALPANRNQKCSASSSSTGVTERSVSESWTVLKSSTALADNLSGETKMPVLQPDRSKHAPNTTTAEAPLGSAAEWTVVTPTGGGSTRTTTTDYSQEEIAIEGSSLSTSSELTDQWNASRTGGKVSQSTCTDAEAFTPGPSIAQGRVRPTTIPVPADAAADRQATVDQRSHQEETTAVAYDPRGSSASDEVVASSQSNVGDEQHHEEVDAYSLTLVLADLSDILDEVEGSKIIQKCESYLKFMLKKAVKGRDDIELNLDASDAATEGDVFSGLLPLVEALREVLESTQDEHVAKIFFDCKKFLLHYLEKAAKERNAAAAADERDGIQANQEESGKKRKISKLEEEEETATTTLQQEVTQKEPHKKRCSVKLEEGSAGTSTELQGIDPTARKKKRRKNDQEKDSKQSSGCSGNELEGGSAATTNKTATIMPACQPDRSKHVTDTAGGPQGCAGVESTSGGFIDLTGDDSDDEYEPVVSAPAPVHSCSDVPMPVHNSGRSAEGASTSEVTRQEPPPKKRQKIKLEEDAIATSSGGNQQKVVATSNEQQHVAQKPRKKKQRVKNKREKEIKQSTGFSSKKKQKQKYPLNMTFWKPFPGFDKPYQGTIMSYNSQTGFYRIHYDDGDSEDLTETLIAVHIKKGNKTVPEVKKA